MPRNDFISRRDIDDISPLIQPCILSPNPHLCRYSSSNHHMLLILCHPSFKSQGSAAAAKYFSALVWPLINSLKGSSQKANPLSQLTQNCLFLTALMLRLIMQDDKSEAQGARLPLKSCFCRRAFRFNVCNKCIYRSKREEEELCEGSRGKTKYMQKGKSCCEDLNH